jgi:chorismate mutase
MLCLNGSILVLEGAGFMRCRGIRGATTVEENTKEAILRATKELLAKLIEANGIDAEEVAYAFFTTTSDLNAEFPALAAREMGWTQAALLCSHEMNVPGSLVKCIRILILYNTERSAGEIVHVYIKGAKNLRANNSPKKLG